MKMKLKEQVIKPVWFINYFYLKTTVFCFLFVILHTVVTTNESHLHISCSTEFCAQNSDFILKFEQMWIYTIVGTVGHFYSVAKV